MDITFSDYQEQSSETAVYPGSRTLMGLAYVALGLGEAGEVQNKIKKMLRGDKQAHTQEFADSIAKELGDLLWYVAQACTELELGMGDVAQQNLDKLNARKAAGTIKGDGDSR